MFPRFRGKDEKVRMKHKRILAAFILALGPLRSPGLRPSRECGKSSAGLPLQLQNVGFEPPLNGQIPLDLNFSDESGAALLCGNFPGSGRFCLRWFITVAPCFAIRWSWAWWAH